MSPEHRSSLAAALVDRLNRSRDFTISCILHIILIAVFGSSVLIQRSLDEPTDFVSPETNFVTPKTADAQRPDPGKTSLPAPVDNLLKAPAPQPPVDIIRTIQETPRFAVPAIPNGVAPTDVARLNSEVRQPAPARPGAISAADRKAILDFTSGIRTKPGSRPGVGTRDDEFQFTAFIGRYSGGNWDSTVRVANGKIENGSLPNLLYFMSSASRNKVKTNYKNVQAVNLDSDELFSVKPPFIFMTGTRDFRLSDREVENLRKYLQMGGAVWGDSSVPGKNSRFDIAFRREMRRVVSDVDKDWEPVPGDHPIYTQAYFPEVKEIPPGLNFYREPAYALKMHGEIAVLYTANDYGDMWQIGLDGSGAIDVRRNDQGAYVALNPVIWENRDGYLRNTGTDSLASAYRFGTNVVIHLLTRWETKTRLTPAL